MLLKPGNTDASHCSECIHICVWISSPENIGPVYKTYMLVSGKGVRGSKDAFLFLANIGNYGQPLAIKGLLLPS